MNCLCCGRPILPEGLTASPLEARNSLMTQGLSVIIPSTPISYRVSISSG